MRAKLFRGWYYAVWRDAGGTRRQSLRTQDRAIAEQRLADLRRNSPASETLTDLAAAYRADKAEIASADRIGYAWDRLAPFWGHLRADQIDRPLCRKYIARRRRDGVQDGTILRELRILRTIVNWTAPEAGAVFAFPSAPPPRDRHLTRDEYVRLLDGCAAPHVRLFVVLALATGGRASALLELTWDRVDFRRGRIDLGSGDGNKRRAVVPMTETARAALSQARAAARTDYVIEYADRPVASIKKGFARAAARAGLEDVTPHVLRHTAAVWMAEAGVPLEEIGQYLGHSDLRTTYRVYARFSPDHLRGAATALEVG